MFNIFGDWRYYVIELTSKETEMKV